MLKHRHGGVEAKVADADEVMDEVKELVEGINHPDLHTVLLALPLHTHSALRTRVAAFQAALLESDPPVKGLDRTIVIDPRRLHLTLGVMPLENEAVVASSSAGASENVSKRTPEKALELLRSLQPSIASILSDTGGGVGVKVPLEELFVFPPGATTGANVLWLGPDMRGIDDVKPRRHGQSPNTSLDEMRRWKERLWKVSDFIHQEFKKAGYITENRPLKLHCTILNTSHRRPRRRETFSYTDVLKSPARALIETERQHGLEDQATGSEEIRSRMTSNPNRSSASEQRGVPNASRADRSSGPYPLPVNLGVYDVNEVQLWVMGSRGPNGEYVSLGGIKLE
ncbi:hypothetical protein BKA70DRAFT_1427824 [Coprinopsis sp. MPI-PUGE-AT-0042]|nr:hypothetical protein BKA70DRAFT_1427824 [Coprinopsis sp. MPI-PUGE-AT-0042]